MKSLARYARFASAPPATTAVYRLRMMIYGGIASAPGARMMVDGGIASASDARLIDGGIASASDARGATNMARGARP